MAERKYKEFVLEDLFEKIKTEKIKGKANDFPTKPSGKYVVPLLTAGVNNQGLVRFAKREQCKTILKNVITISANGANSGATFYQDGEFAVLQDAYAIKLKSMDIPNAQCGIYLTACIRRVLVGNYNWVCKAGWERIKGLSVQLPVTATGFIDWDFMTDYIRELEQERIRELDAYLKAAELDSYELNAEDKRALVLYREALEHKDEPEKCELQFGEFKLGELFDATVGDTDIKRSDINGRGDFVVTAGVANCGILGKSDVAAKVVAANTITVDMFGNCQYRDFPYKMATHARVFSLKSKTEDFNRETELYISTVLRSVLTHFDYNNMCSWNKISDFAIQLPVTTSGDINFDFMEKYIKAIEKISIANVVKYKNKVIAATKQVVNGNSVSAAAAA